MTHKTNYNKGDDDCLMQVMFEPLNQLVKSFI